MAHVDEAIRTELHGTLGDEPVPEHIWNEVSQRIARRSRRRSVRRRTVAALTLAVVVVAVGLIVTNNGVPLGRAHKPQVVDPTAGPGGFTVVPSSGLENNEPVTVSIHGLHPNAFVWITMCVGHPRSFQAGVNQCNAPAKTVNLDPQGGASIRFTVNRYLSPGVMRWIAPPTNPAVRWPWSRLTAWRQAKSSPTRRRLLSRVRRLPRRSRSRSLRLRTDLMQTARQ